MKFLMRLSFLWWFALSNLAFAQSETEIERHRFLRGEIARHDELYFREAAPEISDEAYDELKREFVSLAARHASFSEAGEQVEDLGDDRTGLFPIRRHVVPMLSLRKARTERELSVLDFKIRNVSGETLPVYLVEPKYDGIALSLVYENGRLARAVTRGNGVDGDDLTANARDLLRLPVSLAGEGPFPTLVELRAEAFASFIQFDEINRLRTEAGEAPYANPRAFAAGALRRSVVEGRRPIELSFVIHGWGAWRGPSGEPVSGDDFALRLRDWGLPVAERLGVAHDAETLWALIQEIAPTRRHWPMPTDGVVVKVDDTTLRRRLGDGGGAPAWALAFKYPAETVVTRVRAVTWQVGRTGVVTPVAELDPVRVGGVVVARATLHSPGHARRLDVRVDDEVEIERAGEVIPRILAVKSALRSPDFPSLESPVICPSCGTRLREDSRAGQVHCPFSSCPAQVLRRLEHYVSPAAVNIPGLGPALLERLVHRGVLATPADLYRMSRDELHAAGVAGAAEGLLTAVEESRWAEPWRVINGLGIPRIGATSSRAVANEFGGLSSLLERAEANDFGKGKALTPSVRASLNEYLSDAGNVSVVRQLVELGVAEKSGLVPLPGKLSLDGQWVVFTGALAGMTREEAADRVLAAGGQVMSAVSGRTTLVVAGEGAGEKLEEARRRGIPIVGEAEFRRLLGDF